MSAKVRFLTIAGFGLKKPNPHSVDGLYRVGDEKLFAKNATPEELSVYDAGPHVEVTEEVKAKKTSKEKPPTATAETDELQSRGRDS